LFGREEGPFTRASPHRDRRHTRIVHTFMESIAMRIRPRASLRSGVFFLLPSIRAATPSSSKKKERREGEPTAPPAKHPATHSLVSDPPLFRTPPLPLPHASPPLHPYRSQQPTRIRHTRWLGLCSPSAVRSARRGKCWTASGAPCKAATRFAKPSASTARCWASTTRSPPCPCTASSPPPPA
jgi:hypothetical protein